MVIIPVTFLIVSLVLGVTAYALSSYWGAPPIEYAARIPRWATIFMLPLAFLLFIVAGIEFAVRKPAKSSALPWAIAFVTGWVGAWIGNAIAGSAKDKLLGGTTTADAEA